MKHGQIIIVVFSLLVLGSLAFLETRLNVLQPPKQETFVAMNHPNDFQNEDEGTFSMNINIGYDTLEHHFGFIPDNLIIFNSKKIQGLRLLYNLEDKIMTGGLPSLKSSAFELFDKQNHNIIYTFKKNIGQKFIVDGTDIGVGPYDPTKISNLITGNVILDISNPPTADIPANVEILDLALI